MQRKRIGIIGFGSIAEHGHVPAWQSFPNIEIAAVADVAPDRLDSARQTVPGAALFGSPIMLLDQTDLDGVDICGPPSTHADLIVAACERGVADIVCEKPLVLSEDDYVRVARARARSGSRVISINNWAHSDLNRHILGTIAAGGIGAVQRIDLRIGRPGCALGNAGWMPRWRTNLAYAGGGIILDHGWHQFYLILGWMQAPLVTVRATTRTVNHRHLPVEDEAQIDMQFPASRGRVELSWTAGDRTNDGCVQGEDGTITALDDRVVIDNREGRHELPFRSKLSESSYHPEWFQAVFRSNVLDENRDEADRNFAEAGVLVSVIQAAYRSAEERGKPCRPTFPTREIAERALDGNAELSDVYSSSRGSPT